MTTLNTLLVESVQAVITANGFYDADVVALRAIGAEGVELTSIQCLMLAFDHLACLEETMSIMTVLYEMVDGTDPNMPLLREMMTQLHSKRVANARQRKGEHEQSTRKAESKVFAASQAMSLAQKDQDIAAQAVTLAGIHTVAGERMLADALAAQLAHLNCA